MQKAKIIVAVRKRPLFQKQKSKGYTDIIGIHNRNQVVVSQMKQKVDLTKYIEESVFNFDYAFGEQSSNQQIYNYIMSPLIDSAFEGAKVSCFAYGQTGSGKTYTMNGVMSKNIPGLYTLGAYDIFERLNQPENSHLSAYLSFYEIYCTKLYDLLNKRNELILREDAKSNINVVGLSEIPIYSVEEFQNYLKVGSTQRVTSENSANSQSSRSHAILQISLKNGKKGFGKIYFIDLAGNERGADHMNMKKQTQIDGQEINKSLLQLKECIRGLDQGKNHVPFRGSKLTMCLKDSFIGFCRTVMIGNISPSSGSSENTLNTLRYADRVKQLKNNDDLSKQELKSRQMMLPRGNKNAIKIAISNSDDQEDIAQKKRKALQEYGIKPQEKRDDKRAVTIKEDNISTQRRLSMGTSLKNPQPKANSLAKNVLGNNSNRQMPINKTVQPKKMNVISKNSNTPREEPSDYPARNISNQTQMQYQRYRNEPMQIQKPHGSSVDMRKNLSGIVNYERQQNLTQKNNSSLFAPNHTQSYNEYNNGGQSPPYNNQGNYMQSNQSNQNPVFKTNNFFSGNNQPQNQHINQQTNRQNSQLFQQNNIPMTSSVNNYNMQTQYNQGYRPQQQQQISYEDNRMKMSNIQNNNQYPPVNYQSWNEMIDCMATSRDLGLRDQLLQRLNSHLWNQENELINMHSNTLQNEIQKIKSEMEIIKLIEQDRSQLSSRQYSNLLMDSIDDKISQLQLLRQKVTSFTYKLDDMEGIQQTFDKNRRQNVGEDEQLLDDFE